MCNNSILFFLQAIDKVLQSNTLNMEIIINNKSLQNGLNIIQLETAVGAAMKTFEHCIGINVPRRRFLPVKKTSDLLLVMSNLYSIKNGSLVMSPQRMFPTTPLVKLGDNHFSKVKDFLNRFANIPDLIELDHLTVSGDVTFGRGVSLKVNFHENPNPVYKKSLLKLYFIGNSNHNSQSWRSYRYTFRCMSGQQNCFWQFENS